MSYFPSGGGSGGLPKSQAFTNADSPASFVVPAGVSEIWVEAWGPGGGGAGGGGGSGNGATPGGGGGGSLGTTGQYIFVPMRVTPSETLTITIPVGGAGGTGGAGGNNAVGSDGTDGVDAADTTIAGALQTIIAKGGRGTISPTGGQTPRGKGGTTTAGGVAGTLASVLFASVTGNTGAVGVTIPASGIGSTAGASNASGGGGGCGGTSLPGYGAPGITKTNSVAASGTTGSTAAVVTIFNTRGFIASGDVNGGTGGNGNGTNNGTQGTDVSTFVGYGGCGGGGGGGITSGGLAGSGADGRQGGPGYVIIHYAS